MLDDALKMLIEPAVQALGFALWGFEHASQGAGSVLRIYIENVTTGVTADDCAKVSRQVDAALKVAGGNFAKQYALEVSSPGVRRRLFVLSHYQRFVGDRIDVRLKKGEAIDGRRHFVGELVQVDQDNITLCLDDGVAYTLPFGGVDKAHIANPEKVDRKSRRDKQ